MRTGRVLLAGLLLAAAWSGAARAQTTVNPQALDQLAPPVATHERAPKRPTHPPVRKPVRRPARAPEHTGGKPNPHAALPGTLAPKPAVVKPGALSVPAAPPPAPVLPPPIVVPMRPVPPPPPVPVVADAPGTAIPRKDGMRITFGAGRADLNPATDAALRGLAHAAPPFAATTFAVTAYAAGNADDPSTPRRLALSRALAVRGVLIAEGIPSTRIYVKALGASVPPNAAAEAGAPADRVDIVATTPTPATPPQPAQGRAP